MSFASYSEKELRRLSIFRIRIPLRGETDNAEAPRFQSRRAYLSRDGEQDHEGSAGKPLDLLLHLRQRELKKN